MNHSFSVEVAVDVGLAPAIVFNAIGFWVTQNAANKRNLMDGRYWTYNTVKAWADLFPYLSPKQVEKALTALREHDYVMAGNYNKDKWDRTLWYTLTDKGYAVLHAFPSQGGCISPTGEMEFPHRGNDYIYTVNNTVGNSNTLSGKPDDVPYDEVIDYLNEKTGKHYRSKAAATRKLIKARFADGYTLEDFHRVIDTKTSQWLNTDQDKFLRPETLFRPSHFESYLNESPQTSILDTVDWDKYRLEQIDPSTIH